MSAGLRTLIAPPAGFRSPLAAMIFAGLEEERARLDRDVADVSVAELERQFAPGMNTIGMLLAHIAVAEVHILHVGVAARPDSDVPGVIGITMDDEGIPLPPDGRPPAALAGRDRAFFEGLMARARAETRRVMAGLNEPDLDREVVRRRPDGGERVFNVRWVLYHLLEHAAGHHYQINLLRHLYRTRG